MHAQAILQLAKQDLVMSMLQQPVTFVEKAKLEFVRHLLLELAINGVLRQEDVEDASYIAYMHFMTRAERDECLSWMIQYGNRYIGELSLEQQQELQLLLELCEHLICNGDLSALQQIADLI